MGNTVHRAADAPPLPQPITQPAVATAAQSHAQSAVTTVAPVLVTAASSPAAAAPGSGAFALAPLPPTSSMVGASAAAAAAAPDSYPWMSVLPVIGGSSVLLAAGLAYGVSYSGKQAAKVEEYAEYEIKPIAEPEIEITPEMRRLAVRRAFTAFGLGTALCVGFGVASSYSICRYWEVYTVRDLSHKFAEVVVEKKERFMAPLNRLPALTSSAKLWLSSTWVGSSLRIAPPPLDAEGRPIVAQHAQLSDAENAELDLLAAEGERMEREWSESWSGKQQAAKDAAKEAATVAATAAAANSSNASASPSTPASASSSSSRPMQSSQQPMALSQHQVDERNRNKMSRFLQSLLLKSWALKQEHSGRSEPRPILHVSGEPFGRLLNESLRLLADHLGVDEHTREWQRHEFIAPIVLARVQAADADFDSFVTPAEDAQSHADATSTLPEASVASTPLHDDAAAVPASTASPRFVMQLDPSEPEESAAAANHHASNPRANSAANPPFVPSSSLPAAAPSASASHSNSVSAPSAPRAFSTTAAPPSPAHSFPFRFRTPLQPGLTLPLGPRPRLQPIRSDTDDQELISHRVVLSIPEGFAPRLECLQNAVSEMQRARLLREGELLWIAPVAPGAFPDLQRPRDALVVVMQLRFGTQVKGLLAAIHRRLLRWSAAPWAETEVQELQSRFGDSPSMGGRVMCRSVFNAVGGEIEGEARCRVKYGGSCKFSHDPNDLLQLYRLSRESARERQTDRRHAAAAAASSSASGADQRNRRRSRSRERSRSRSRRSRSRSRERDSHRSYRDRSAAAPAVDSRDDRHAPRRSLHVDSSSHRRSNSPSSRNDRRSRSPHFVSSSSRRSDPPPPPSNDRSRRQVPAAPLIHPSRATHFGSFHQQTSSAAGSPLDAAIAQVQPQPQSQRNISDVVMGSVEDSRPSIPAVATAPVAPVADQPHTVAHASVPSSSSSSAAVASALGVSVDTAEFLRSLDGYTSGAQLYQQAPAPVSGPTATPMLPQAAQAFASAVQPEPRVRGGSAEKKRHYIDVDPSSPDSDSSQGSDAAGPRSKRHSSNNSSPRTFGIAPSPSKIGSAAVNTLGASAAFTAAASSAAAATAATGAGLASKTDSAAASSEPMLTFDRELSQALMVEAGEDGPLVFRMAQLPNGGRSDNPAQLGHLIVVRHLTGLVSATDLHLELELQLAYHRLVTDLALPADSIRWIARMRSFPGSAENQFLVVRLSTIAQTDVAVTRSRAARLKPSVRLWSVFELYDLNEHAGVGADGNVPAVCVPHFIRRIRGHGCKAPQVAGGGFGCGHSHELLHFNQLSARRDQRRMAAGAAWARPQQSQAAAAAAAPPSATAAATTVPIPPVAADNTGAAATALPASSVPRRPAVHVNSLHGAAPALHGATPAASFPAAQPQAAPAVAAAPSSRPVVIDVSAEEPVAADPAADASPFVALHFHADGSAPELSRLSRDVAYSANRDELRRRLVLHGELTTSALSTPEEKRADLQRVVEQLCLKRLLQPGEVLWAARTCAPCPFIPKPAVILQLRPWVEEARVKQLTGDKALGLATTLSNELRQLNQHAGGRVQQLCLHGFFQRALGSNTIRCTSFGHGDTHPKHDPHTVVELDRRLEAAVAAGTAEPRLCAPLRQRMDLPDPSVPLAAGRLPPPPPPAATSRPAAAAAAANTVSSSSDGQPRAAVLSSDLASLYSAIAAAGVIVPPPTSSWQQSATANCTGAPASSDVNTWR